MKRAKARVFDAHEAHPEWCDLEIAYEAKCHSAYVRALIDGLPSRKGRDVRGFGREWKAAAVDVRMARLGEALRALLGEAG